MDGYLEKSRGGLEVDCVDWTVFPLSRWIESRLRKEYTRYKHALCLYGPYSPTDVGYKLPSVAQQAIFNM